MAVELLIITHGNLAEALNSSMKMIVGEINLVTTFCLKENDNPLQLKANIQKFHEENKKKNLLILTDLLFGTPFNSVIKLTNHKNIFVLTGVNLPMVLEAVISKDHMTFLELCDCVKNAGINGIVSNQDISSLIKEETCQ